VGSHGGGGATAPGPKNRLVPLLAVLAVVVIGAGAFLLLRGGDDDAPTEVAGTTVTKSDDAASGATKPTQVAVSTTAAPATTSTPSPVAGLTPTQQRELCHVAIVGQVEGQGDTGDPLETCTSSDFVSVSAEVGVYLRADPATDYQLKLNEACATARSVGRNPLACEGIATS
jgi:hypothetical protein